MNTTKIIEKIEPDRFQELIRKYENAIFVGAHAIDHLSMAQRKVFKEDALIKPLLQELPAGVGLQRNGRHAVFYKRNKYYLKLIIHIEAKRIEIITFINTENILNLERLQND